MINVAARFDAIAAQVPDQLALDTPLGRMTYGALAKRVDRHAHALAAAGIGPGARAVMLVPASPEFFALVMALFKLGAVPVFIDPAMGFANMGKVLAEAEPSAFVGIAKAHLARALGGWGKHSLKALVTAGSWAFPGTRALDKLPASEAPYPVADTSADTPAAILFTSGSTGVPKGALHTHGSFDVQAGFVRDQFYREPGEVHVAAFPIFALFDITLGATTVLPPGDLTRPAQMDPASLVRAVKERGATCLYGSPALLDNLGKHGEKLPGLRSVVSASGPVLPAILERLDRLVDAETTIHVPYGATEGLPISVIGHREALALAPRWAGGEGLCIGRPLASVELAIIGITDEAIAAWPDARRLPPGEVGEIAVKGPIISPAYIARPQANALAKVPDPAGGFWHRMGDVGRLDDEGRLWFYGRKAHRVVTAEQSLFTIACEAVFLQHPLVQRAALVGVTGKDGVTRPVMCIQPEPGRASAPMARELVEWAAQHPHTAAIREVLFHPRFPVDIRHNSKIFREQLAVWATRELV